MAGVFYHGPPKTHTLILGCRNDHYYLMDTSRVNCPQCGCQLRYPPDSPVFLLHMDNLDNNIWSDSEGSYLDMDTSSSEYLDSSSSCPNSPLPPLPIEDGKCPKGHRFPMCYGMCSFCGASAKGQEKALATAQQYMG